MKLPLAAEEKTAPPALSLIGGQVYFPLAVNTGGGGGRSNGWNG